MTFGRFRQSTDLFEPMAEINVTPLVDVTLVLLVVFIIAAPLLTYAIKLDLPAAQAALAGPAPAAIDVSIDAAGTLYWNRTVVDGAGLEARLKEAAAATPQPELHLRADRAVRYEVVAQLMSAAQRAGLQHIGFVTDPAASTGRARSSQH
ncbi:MAG TPA: biopolymer transporter ExbD [Burkholderiaceae bacterium]|nr:biopolymer transporter ExbD [Burkholderiaceae bacterium]